MVYVGTIEEKLEVSRNLIKRALDEGEITEEEIISNFKKNINDILNIYSSKDKSYLDLLLAEIYLNPYILCDQNISIRLRKLLPLLLDVRYKTELAELDYLFNEVMITKDEYNSHKKNLDFLYYGSSKDGRRIKKEGVAIGIIKKKNRW